MAFLLDASVLGALLDGSEDVQQRARTLETAPLTSVVALTMVAEKTAGDPARSARLELIISALPLLSFDEVCAAKYGEIIKQVGFDWRRILTRMIAAQAIVHRATLVTLNPTDFSDMPGLSSLAL